MRYIKTRLVFYPFILLLLIATLGGVWLLIDYTAPGPLSEPKTVLFKKGSGFFEIVDLLEEQDVIRNKYSFIAIGAATGKGRKFKAGEYKFSAAISPSLVMDMIAKGDVVVHKVTVPEGLAVLEVKTLLEAEDTLEGDFPDDVAEGSLLPETYHYVYGDTRSDIVGRMQKAMRTTLDELWESRRMDTPIKTKEQALILASIIEKETSVKSEYGKVASVFVNRLRKGMLLQTDPTVIYAITKGAGPLGRRLLRKDLTDTDSPYNTYKYPGLTPAPISNPGRGAVAAALNPPDSEYIFFVATGDGGHNFSKTLAEHNRNVAAFRKKVGR